MGIGYSFLTTTLNIDGITDVDANNWNVYWPADDIDMFYKADGINSSGSMAIIGISQSYGVRPVLVIYKGD